MKRAGIMNRDMHIIELQRFLESIVNSNVTENFPYSWDENTITATILKSLHKKCRHFNLYGLIDHNVTIEWEDPILRYSLPFRDLQRVIWQLLPRYLTALQDLKGA